ncbi:MAG: hypothetical protein V3S98_01140 [Dehalococcoidia bacterium]
MIVKTIGGTKRKVYVSFDYERDRAFCDFFTDQGGESGATWQVAHSSHAYDGSNHEWLIATTRGIKRCEVLVAILGPTAFRSPGVLKEIQIAEILKKTVFQIIPYGVGKPNIIPTAGRVIRWDFEAVKRFMAASAPPPRLPYGTAFTI